jgi:hypothetical protein
MGDDQTEVGSLIGSLSTSFPWGLILVTDHGSTDEVPSFPTARDTVAVGRNCLVVKVEHEQFGRAMVHVYEGAGDLSGSPAFDGMIESASGVITVGDALGTSTVRVEVGEGPTRLQVHVDHPTEAGHVDIVFFQWPAAHDRPGRRRAE